MSAAQPTVRVRDRLPPEQLAQLITDYASQREISQHAAATRLLQEGGG